MRTLVVGDIHGGLRALEQVLERAQVSSNDKVIFVGDYVDGWSENAETIRFLMNFSESYSCVFLRGNHDELVYNFLKKGDDRAMWLAHGGQASKDSYAKLSEEEIEKHIAFYEALEYYHIDKENRLFLHAGFTNMHGPQHEYYPNMVYWDRTLWEMACSLDPDISSDNPFYPRRLTLFREIYIGHTPVTRIGEITPQQKANVWNVDTGAAFKGLLSIIDADSKEFWQSDPVWTLYPDEKGRN
ncbi:serine/threonine protein phosphatase [Aureitalea sp. L0-47]|uniref:metallophosphoesterase family protein n=1 Tax=Aureitalea sp. L0-47 TaxID=2816962 RepID=UPI002238240A|nr:metallophosphoesterase family protein [Aureitalea sp. L0-47]MCW5520908.1 serine/threonine protein phosphatase [Aureitalea sp. L0-47]